MILNVILGRNIDTLMWINDLKEMKEEHIIVIDYENIDALKKENNIIYMSPNYAKEYMKKFDSINYYKSMYAYPGMFD